MKILLYRPPFTQFCRRNQAEAPHAVSDTQSQIREPTARIESSIFTDFNLSCSKGCVEAAIALANLMSEICQTELASVWWYSVFCMNSARSN